jgi:acyl-CoA reductase-like NAD-dependent aldehyde dehydrogenase
VPRLFVTRSIDAQRRLRPLAAAERKAALTKAADAFVSATIGGLDFETYVDLTCRVTGLPMTAARAGAYTVAESLTTACDAVRPAQPTGAIPDWRELSPTGGAVWARRGEVLAVHAPGNAPGVHGLWPQALVLGYRVAVRPSRREPFTAHRLIHALRQKGFRDGHALYLPTDHTVADDIIGAADLAMVYGGQDIVDRYAQDPNVLTNGPGRTKILITADCDWREYLETIVDSIVNLGGMASWYTPTNTERPAPRGS